MADFQIEGGLDDRGILEGFRRIEQAGIETGNKVGAGFEDSLNRFGKRSIATLQNDLARLQSRQLRVNVDSTAFTKTGEKIKEIQALIEKANAKKLVTNVDLSTLNGLQAKLQSLQQQSLNLKVNSTEYRNAQLQVDSLQRKITALGTTPVPLNSLQSLNQELQRLQARQVKLNVDSTAFVKTTQRIAEVQQKISDLDRRKVLITADPTSIVAMRARLQELTGQLDRVGSKSVEFQRLQTAIRSATKELERAQAPALQLGSLDAIVQGIAFSVANTLTAAIGTAAQAFGDFVKASISQAIEFESITRKLANTLGNAGAAVALQFTKKLADDLGLSYKTLAGTFASFTAAATSAGVPMSQQRDLFAAVAKSGQALGLSNDALKGTFVALQQIASKGVVSMEELRQQLGERLPIAFAAAAKGLGVTQSQLIKLVETGNLSAAEFFPAFTKGLNEITASAGGVLTTEQALNKLTSSMENLQAAIGTDLLASFKDTSLVLANVLDLLSKNATQLTATFIGFAASALGAVAGLNGLGAAVAGLFGISVKNAREEQARLNAEADKLSGKYLASGGSARELSKVQLEINKTIAAAPLRKFDQDIALATQVLALAKATSDLEISRYGITTASLDYQLKVARDQKASASEIAVIEEKKRVAEQAGLTAKFASLQKTQALEAESLRLTQEKTRLDANIKVDEQRLALRVAELKLKNELNGKDVEAKRTALDNYNLAKLKYDSAVGTRTLLGQTQQLEVQIAAATQETAQNGIIAEAASKGMANSLPAAGRASEGLRAALGAAGASAQATAAGTTAVERAAAGAVKPSAEVAQNFGAAAKPIGSIATDAGTAGGNTKTLAQSSRDYAAYMASAKTFAERIANLDLGRGVGAAANAAGTLASRMAGAASQARAFYDALARASGLPPSRFTGGGVEAGGRYRINDGPGGRSLGQEAFLSSTGALSLINRPANSMWTAPSKGLVLPAAVTEHLKQQGAFAGRGGGAAMRARSAPARQRQDPSTARMELAITRLSNAVDRLEKKDWSVQVRVRNESGGASFLNTLNRMG